MTAAGGGDPRGGRTKFMGDVDGDGYEGPRSAPCAWTTTTVYLRKGR